MFSRERKTPIAEWWWTIDKPLLAALILLMITGVVLSFAASPPVAERLGLGPWHFIIRQAIFAALALPVLMLHFLINVTGIKATEAQALSSKGEAYREYQLSVSPFIPWFPRKVVLGAGEKRPA